MVKPGSDAAVFYLREANKILAATTDCNSLYCALDPREGGRIAVAEAARNLTCSGARPLAITDNLNFGNPYKPENFWQLREAVEGVTEACRALGTPVTGGNVSLYNESPAGVVDPTPTIAMVGLIEHERHITTQWFKNAGDAIVLVGEIGSGLGASRFVKVLQARKIGPVPRVDLECEIAVQSATRDLIRAGLVKSAHDCSEGGLAVALAECCFNPDGLLGAQIDLCSHGSASRADNASHRDAATADLLFNESQSRIVLSVSASDLEKVLSELSAKAMPHAHIGSVSAENLNIAVNGEVVSWPIAELHDVWFNSIRRAVESDSEPLPSL